MTVFLIKKRAVQIEFIHYIERNSTFSSNSFGKVNSMLLTKIESVIENCDLLVVQG